MNKFIILRVSASIAVNGNHERRKNYDRAELVGEFSDRKNWSETLGNMQRHVTRWFYYGFELSLMGDPDRKSAIPMNKKNPVRTKKTLLSDSKIIPISQSRESKRAEAKAC